MKPCHALLISGLLATVGCTAPALRSQSPEQLSDVVESRTRLVGDVARPFGNNYIKAEGVGLVTGLAGTGEDPAPSPQRASLIAEMQIRGVSNPNQVLASPNTALILIRAFLPPGAQKGDKLDLEVQVPSRSETTSLRGGFLMETRLTEMAVLGNQIHDGHVLAKGQGSILVDPSADGEKDRALLVRGHVLGGGVVLKNRALGLVIPPEDKSIRLSSQIGAAINRRFHTFNAGVKQGVANPKTDEFVELKVHPRYKDNIGRYMRVVRSVPIRESVGEQAERIQLLETQLLDPVTSATAALRLEAIGKEAVKTLEEGISAKDLEVRFYSAEALAYLDQSAAAPALAAAAKEEPAFRVYSLAALSAMDDIAAYDELCKLLEVQSAETRYGAFRALWAMNAKDAVVRGEDLGQQFSYHIIKTSGPPMVHVTRSFRPEIVLFGDDQRFQIPMVVDAGRSIMVSAQAGSDQVTVSRYLLGEPEQRRVVSTKVDDVIRAIVELGGTYPDVVQALQQAKSSGSLESRFEVDALPGADRVYQHKDSEDGKDDSALDAEFEVANPVPELFKPKTGKHR